MHCYEVLCDAMGYLAGSRGTEGRKKGRKEGEKCVFIET
jgi:hypothetical protein